MALVAGTAGVLAAAKWVEPLASEKAPSRRALPPQALPQCAALLRPNLSGCGQGCYRQTGSGVVAGPSASIFEFARSSTQSAYSRLRPFQVGCSLGQPERTPGTQAPLQPGSSDDEDSSGGSPRRSVGVQFTCNKCKEQTTRYVNPLALKKGTIFLKCGGCDVIHKFVDNLGLIEEINYKEEREAQKTDS